MTSRELPNTVGQNAGLALTRFVPFPKVDSQRTEFFQSVTKIAVSNAYTHALARWKQTMKARKALVVTATLGGPLALGLGNESPYEVGLTLHRIYGTPVIPGSAIKGACLRALATQNEATKGLAKKLLGEQENAGYALFHDVWLEANPNDQPLCRDVITVHHPQYYQEGKVFPTDFDDPSPVAFIAVRPGTKFYFAVELLVTEDVRPGWSDFTEAMLTYTLREIGIGGKTNSGYGWFDKFEVERPPVVLSPQAQLAQMQGEIDKLDASGLGGKAQALLETATNPEHKRLIAAALKQRAERIGRWDKKTIDKAWRKAIEEVLQ